MRPRPHTAAAAVAFLGSILLANWLTTRYGMVPAGFGLTVTAGTYAAGAALVARDVVQDWGGRRLVLALIAAGAVLSFAVADGRIALASGAAFLLAELLDMAVYTPLRGRARQGTARWSGAVAASNAAGALLDTVVFLAVAFGAAAVTGHAVLGQLVGKGWVTLAVVAAFAAARAGRREALPEPV